MKNGYLSCEFPRLLKEGLIQQMWERPAPSPTPSPTPQGEAWFLAEKEIHFEVACGCGVACCFTHIFLFCLFEGAFGKRVNRILFSM